MDVGSKLRVKDLYFYVEFIYILYIYCYIYYFIYIYYYIYYIYILGSEEIEMSFTSSLLLLLTIPHDLSLIHNIGSENGRK